MLMQTLVTTSWKQYSLLPFEKSFDTVRLISANEICMWYFLNSNHNMTRDVFSSTIPNLK